MISFIQQFQAIILFYLRVIVVVIVAIAACVVLKLVAFKLKIKGLVAVLITRPVCLLACLPPCQDFLLPSPLLSRPLVGILKAFVLKLQMKNVNSLRLDFITLPLDIHLHFGKVKCSVLVLLLLPYSSFFFFSFWLQH